MNDLTLNPRTELQADTMKVLTPAERWVWVGLRMLAVGSKNFQIHCLNIPERLQVGRILYNMACHKLKRIKAISVRKGVVTVHSGYNPGDRVREQIMYHVISYINWRMKRRLRTGNKFMRINMRTRINEGAKLEDFKKVIDHMYSWKYGSLAESQIRKIFYRDRFWEIIETK